MSLRNSISLEPLVLLAPLDSQLSTIPLLQQTVPCTWKKSTPAVFHLHMRPCYVFCTLNCTWVYWLYNCCLLALYKFTYYACNGPCIIGKHTRMCTSDIRIWSHQPELKSIWLHLSPRKLVITCLFYFHFLKCQHHWNPSTFPLWWYPLFEHETLPVKS